MSAPTAPAPRALLPPPEERLYASFQDLHEDLKKWTLEQGYALSIDASSNRDATGMYRRYNMSCVKGGKAYKPTTQGKRRSYSKKTGCPMKIKCTKQDAWPWNGRWRVTVMCGDHNHSAFDPNLPDEVPPAFRHVEGEGLRWLLIMHREAQLTLRQLTIGLRVTFGDKYKYIKKADVSNMLSKVKREEERELARRPPGAPPLPPGTMTAFMAALLNPVPDPYANGVRYELISDSWPNVPGYQPVNVAQQHQAGQHPQQQPLPQAPPQYTQQAFQPQPYVQPQQLQGGQPNYGQPQHFVPSQQQPQAAPVYGGQTFAAGQRPLQWKNYGPPPPAPAGQAAQEVQPQHQPQQLQQPQPVVPQQPQQQVQPLPQQDHQPAAQQQQQAQQQAQVQQAPAQQPQQPIPQPASTQQQPYTAQPGAGPQQRSVTGGKSLYRPSSALQPVAVAGVPGAVVMPRSFSPVSEDESDEQDAEAGEDDEEEDEDGDGDEE